MKYYVTWKEKCTTINMCSGWVNANSEEEAREILENSGVDEFEDCYEIDNYDNEILEICKVEKYYEE